MALSASAVYHLTVEEMRQTCVKRGLDSNDQAKYLRRKLAEQVKSETIERPEQLEVTLEIDPPFPLLSAASSEISNHSQVSQHGSEGCQASVLVELLRQVIPLSFDKPVEILRLFFYLGVV